MLTTLLATLVPTLIFWQPLFLADKHHALDEPKHSIESCRQVLLDSIEEARPRLLPGTVIEVDKGNNYGTAYNFYWPTDGRKVLIAKMYCHPVHPYQPEREA